MKGAQAASGDSTITDRGSHGPHPAPHNAVGPSEIPDPGRAGRDGSVDAADCLQAPAPPTEGGGGCHRGSGDSTITDRGSHGPHPAPHNAVGPSEIPDPGRAGRDGAVDAADCLQAPAPPTEGGGGCHRGSGDSTITDRGSHGPHPAPHNAVGPSEIPDPGRAGRDGAVDAADCLQAPAPPTEGGGGCREGIRPSVAPDHLKVIAELNDLEGTWRSQQSVNMAEDAASGMSLPNDWGLNSILDSTCRMNFANTEIWRHKCEIMAEEAKKMPLVGDKEPLTALTAEYQSDPIFLQKMAILDRHYASIRRVRADGNCFFRSFMFSYLEYILETQDIAEADRMKTKIEECWKSLRDAGHYGLAFEMIPRPFVVLLNSVIQGKEYSISDQELLKRCRDQTSSDPIVMLLRYVTSDILRRHSDTFGYFIPGGPGMVDEFCQKSVLPMGEESDNLHIIALSDALGVRVRVQHLDHTPSQDGVVRVIYHDFILPNRLQRDAASSDGSSRNYSIKPLINLLYRQGLYDILYPKPLKSKLPQIVEHVDASPGS